MKYWTIKGFFILLLHKKIKNNDVLIEITTINKGWSFLPSISFEALYNNQNTKKKYLPLSIININKKIYLEWKKFWIQGGAKNKLKYLIDMILVEINERI